MVVHTFNLGHRDRELEASLVYNVYSIASATQRNPVLIKEEEIAVQYLGAGVQTFF